MVMVTYKCNQEFDIINTVEITTKRIYSDVTNSNVS